MARSDERKAVPIYPCMSEAQTGTRPRQRWLQEYSTTRASARRLQTLAGPHRPHPCRTSEDRTSEPVSSHITVAMDMHRSASSTAHSTKNAEAEALPFVRCFCVISTSGKALSIKR